VRSIHDKAIDIVELSLDGLRNQEIADDLHMGLRTVQKIKHAIDQAWEKVLTQEKHV
jgi:DNA-binding NarL/FixJ family response regulator